MANDMANDDDQVVLSHSRRAKRKCVQSDDDDDEHHNAIEDVDNKENTTRPQQHKRIRKILSDDTINAISLADNQAGPSTTPKKRKPLSDTNQVFTDDGDDDGDDDDIIVLDENNNEMRQEQQQQRKKHRAIIADSQLEPETREALDAERKRLERLRTREAVLAVKQEIKTEQHIFLDCDMTTKSALLFIDPTISSQLKPHQVDGIKFMWSSCYESVEAIRNNTRSAGGGCVLAHCMGLGKTLQVIGLVHTLLANQELTKVTRVMIFTPFNALLNWRSEFDKWLAYCDYKPVVRDISEVKTISARLDVLRNWFETGGVFLIGYQMFLALLAPIRKRKEHIQDELDKYLLNPGADLVVCDEGHVLKNDNTKISTQINRLRTSKRIVLTGTPLQNNLNEYWCMVSFVKPNYLGTKKEFRNRFANPIENGQHRDSTVHEVQFMKQRTHILHKTLQSCVQRKDFETIKAFLPVKQEYAIFVRLTAKQCDLYETYLNAFSFGKQSTINQRMNGVQLFTDFHNFSRICTHPWLLKIHADLDMTKESKRLNKRQQDENDDDDDDDRSLFESDDDGFVELKFDTLWWNKMVTSHDEYNAALSGKLMVLAGLLHKAYECDDKILVFSQRLPSLDLIEKFLHQWSMYPYSFEPDPKTKMKWLPMIDYCRIDGSVDSRTRRELVTSFNDPDNYRLRLFLISTKAGGIGVNLTAANRVVIFDASWNPSDDIQAMWRVYRFGQDKPCYIYRLLAQGTMEEKIYMRQVAKQSLARRVVDEQQLDRHYSKAEIRELYTFQPDRYETGQQRNRIKCPADPAFASIINTCEEWISRYHEHDSLFQNRVDEALTPAELNEGWRQYDAEVKCKTVDTRGPLKIEPAILHLPIIHIHLPPNLDTSQKLKYIEQNPNLYLMCMREQIKKDIAEQENEEYEDHIDYKNALIATKKSKKKPKK